MRRVKVDMELIVKASPAIVYKFLTNTECIVRWFCDDVDITGDSFVYSWDGEEEEAILIDDIEEERLRFQWVDEDDEEYLEFRMYKNDVTHETIIEITDFCDEGDEKTTADLWESQIDQMRKSMGG